VRLLGSVLAVSGALWAQKAPSAKVVLSEALDAWKRQIEELGGGRVVVSRIHHDRERNLVVLPEDAGDRPVLRRFFLNPSFLSQFLATHAMSINYDGPEGKIHFIVLNMARAGEWGHAEEALLSHEFGHVWLNARGLALPGFEPGPRACVRIHAGDAVQHVLIFREIRRRGVDYNRYWLPNLETALGQLEQRPAGAPPDPFCQRVSQLALWVDVRLGLPDGEWEHAERFLELMARHYPEHKQPTEELVGLLRAGDLNDRDTYDRALAETLAYMERVAP